MLAVPQQRRHSARKSGERNHLLPTFEAREDEVLIFANRTAQDSAELVLVVVVLGTMSKVALKTVRVENPVPPIFEDVAMPIIGAGFEGRVDHAAAEPPVCRVVGVCLHLEFLHRLDVRRKLPTPG